MYPPNQDYQKSPPPSAPPPEFSHYAQPPPPQPQYGGAQYANGVPVHSVAPSQWSTGLCDCGDDVPNCCITCWCPCITFGQVAEIVDKGTTSCGVHGALYALIAVVTGCACIYSCVYRSKMRSQYMLPERPCNDFILHCCCDSCALCQEYRELKHRGFDMSIGWEGNIARQNGGVAMPPMVHGGMTR